MINPKEFNEKLSTARRLSQGQRFNEAEVIYRELLQAGEQSELLLNELVRLYWKVGKATEAIDILENLTQIAPEQLGYYLDLASICEQSGDLDKSAESYRRLLQRKPDLPNTWYNLGRLLKKLGKFTESLNAYQKSLDYDVSSPEEVHNNMAVIYSEMRRESDAISSLEKAVEINPAYIPALFNLGGLFEEEGRSVEAAEQYREILTREPDHFPALCRMAHMAGDTIDNNWLLKELKRALAKPDIDPAVREELLFANGKLLDESGQFDKAFDSYQKANELGRQRFPVYSKSDQEKTIERLIRLFNRDWFAEVQGYSGHSPIFICGMYRSGSTLAEQILSGHPRVTAGGELDYFPRLAKDFPPDLLDPERRGSCAESAAGDYLKYLSGRFGQYDLLTDKRPDNFLNLGLIKTLFPNAKVIWTQRELLDNCLSIYFQYLGGDMNYSVDLDFIGHYYSEQRRLMEHWQTLFPETIYPLSYEKLVESPEKEVRALLEFLGLDWEASCLNFSQRENRVKTASIWQVRQPIYKKSRSRHENYSQYLKALDQYRA